MAILYHIIKNHMNKSNSDFFFNDLLLIVDYQFQHRLYLAMFIKLLKTLLIG